MRSPLLALIKKDIKGYFDQPAAYILIVPFVAVLSYVFFSQALLTAEASLRPLFTVDFEIQNPSLPWLLALFVPAATMRLLAEENRDGTLESLLTHPIRRVDCADLEVPLRIHIRHVCHSCHDRDSHSGPAPPGTSTSEPQPDSTSAACSWPPRS